MKRIALLGFIVLFIACPSSHKNSASIYIAQGEYVRAKEQALEGLKATPGDYELYLLLGKAEIGLTSWLAASNALLQGIAVDSSQSIKWMLADKNNISVYRQTFYNSGVSFAQEKKYDKALVNLGYCHILDPDDVSAWVLEGGIYAEVGNAEKSSNAYKQALAIDPENPEAHYRVGKAYYDNKEYDSASKRFNDAIKYYEMQHNAAAKTVFQNLPAVDKALSYEIISLFNEKKKAELAELIKVKLGFDDPAAQDRNIERFVKTTEGLSRTYYWTGMTHLNLKNDSLALALFQKSLDLKSDYFEALFYSGEVMLRQGKYQAAQGFFEKATEVSDELYAWFYLAVCHTQLKKYQKAIEIYENEVLRMDPKNIETMTNLAFCYRELGNTKKSLEYLMKAESLQKEK
ncbi:MAG: tetratricopeptide repeat protein [candidate division WOR-3 bacterium]|nr:MAG: tetratricopeptide repeat protein [candidate division WOR-3 bacterium]